MPTANPLLTPSPLPLGYPPFDLIKDEHFAPAFDLGMAEQLTEIAAITGHPEPATFENTILALERSGQLLGRVSRVFSNLNGCHTNPTLQTVEKSFAPKLAAHRDAILLNAALFTRIAALHALRASLALDPESDRLYQWADDLAQPLDLELALRNQRLDPGQILSFGNWVKSRPKRTKDGIVRLTEEGTPAVRMGTSANQVIRGARDFLVWGAGQPPNKRILLAVLSEMDAVFS